MHIEAKEGTFNTADLNIRRLLMPWKTRHLTLATEVNKNAS